MFRSALRFSNRWRLLAVQPQLKTTQTIASIVHDFTRHKHTTSGIQGIRNSKQKGASKDKLGLESDELEDFENSQADFNLENDADYECLVNDAMHVVKTIRHEQNVLVIQPYIKWGPRKSPTPPDLKVQEAEALVRSLDKWAVADTIKVGLLNFDQKSLFGKGKLEELKRCQNHINHTKNKITCVFISRGILTYPQKQNLEQVFNVPVMDRFSVVIQILRMHAKSRESRLQVAMAEIPYIWKQLGDNLGARGKLNDSQKLLLKNREKKIKAELEDVRGHRQLIRKKRFQKQFPIIAVVGYTNAGKTSLIKALTKEESIQPRNQLFATLEITAHGGVLPCNLDVIYMDTIGFMSDIPTGLIECFVATLEDAMLADLIIHVQDVSHKDAVEQGKHVEKTLKTLLHDTDPERQQLLKNVITVGNKCDLVSDLDAAKDVMSTGSAGNAPVHLISSTTMQGVNDLLKDVERNILKITNRMKMVIRVPMGGEELAWLYKNSAVTRTIADENNSEYLFTHVVITELVLQQFKNTFLKKKLVA